MYYRYAIGMAGPEGEPDGPEFSLGDDELAYVFPSDGSMSCVAVSVNLREYAAMRSTHRPRCDATFLAEALDDLLTGRTGETPSMAAYHRRRDEHTLSGFRETCQLGRDLNAFRDTSSATRTAE